MAESAGCSLSFDVYSEQGTPHKGCNSEWTTAERRGLPVRNQMRALVRVQKNVRLPAELVWVGDHQVDDAVGRDLAFVATTSKWFHTRTHMPPSPYSNGSRSRRVQAPRSSRLLQPLQAQLVRRAMCRFQLRLPATGFKGVRLLRDPPTDPERSS